MSGEVVLNGVVQGLLLLAALLAWPVTWLLLRRYRRQVVRAMQRTSVDQARRARPSAVPTPTGDGSATAADPSVPSAAVGVDATAGGARESLASIRNRVATRRIVLWRRYAAAGASQAGVLTVATFLAADIEFLPVRTLLVWVVYAWPVVLTVAILSGFDRMVVATTTGLYVAVVVGLGVLGGDVDGALALWALMGLLATVVVVPYLHRSVRAVGVVVLAFVFIGLVGAELVLAFVGASSGRISAVVTVTSWLGVGGGAFVLLIVLGFAVAGVAGWFALGRFGRAYRHNGLPDQLVLVGAVWALFAAAHGFPLAFEGAWWAGAGLVGFAAFWLVAARPLDGDAEPSGPRLLMLRVFALGRNSEQLFRQVATDWQYVGPMRLIAGPDLARATVEPDEFLTFAAGRLEDLFISVLSQLEARRHEGVRDRHGRYRVQEYLCFDDTWRPVVRHLIQDTDLVLMDLRGFVQGNDGARHELTLLASTGMLASTTLVVDKATDLAQVESAVIEGVGNFSDATLVTLQDRRRLRLVDMVPDRWREGS